MNKKLLLLVLSFLIFFAFSLPVYASTSVTFSSVNTSSVPVKSSYITNMALGYDFNNNIYFSFDNAESFPSTFQFFIRQNGTYHMYAFGTTQFFNSNTWYLMNSSLITLHNGDSLCWGVIDSIGGQFLGNGSSLSPLIVSLPSPTIPTGLNISGLGGSGTLTWTTNPSTDNVTSYNVFLNGSKIANTTATSYSFSNFSPGTYSFTVSAINLVGESLQSNAIYYNVAPIAPTVAFSNITATSATATWSATTGATYDIYLNGAFLVNTTSLSYDLTTLSQNTTYTISVVTKTSYGNSIPGTTTFTTEALPSPPDGLQASNITTTTMDLSWSAVSSATSYILDQNGNVLDSTPNAFYHVTGLTPNTTYTFQVAVITQAGKSIFSNPISVSTLGLPPVAPSGLSAGNVTRTTFTAYWLRQSDASNGYKIYLNGNYVANIPQTLLFNPNYDFTGLNEGSTNTITVVAVNQWGDSTPSQPLSVTMMVSPPVLRAIVDNNFIKLTWIGFGSSFNIMVNNALVAHATISPYVVTEKPGTYQVQIIQNYNGQQYPSNVVSVTVSALQNVGSVQMTSDLVKNVGIVAAPIGGLIALALALKGSPMLLAAAKAFFLK